MHAVLSRYIGGLVEKAPLNCAYGLGPSHDYIIAPLVRCLSQQLALILFLSQRRDLAELLHALVSPGHRKG
jgi:hypothetical protein